MGQARRKRMQAPPADPRVTHVEVVWRLRKETVQALDREIHASWAGEGQTPNRADVADFLLRRFCDDLAIAREQAKRDQALVKEPTASETRKVLTTREARAAVSANLLGGRG